MGRQYTIEEKMTAINLFKELGHYTWVITDLGYPSRGMLMLWVKEYNQNGSFPKRRKSKYTSEQRKNAIEYYLNNGMSIIKTISALGYPGKTLMREWINSDIPKENRKSHCKNNRNVVRYSQEQKFEIVSKYCGGSSSTVLSKEYGIAPGTVRAWAKSLLGQESITKLNTRNSNRNVNADKTIENLLSEKEALEKKVSELQNDVYRLQMQKDILEKAGELLKKQKALIRGN